MAITQMTSDLNIIAALDNEPNDVGGLTPAQAKAKFDEAGNTIKDYINATLIPSVTTEITGVVAGSFPVQSEGIAPGAVTMEKLHSAAIATQAQAEGGAADAVLMTPERTKQAIAALVKADFPFETLTATWSEDVAGTATVIKTFTHTLGSIPSKVKLFFGQARYTEATAFVEIQYKGGAYNYTMSGYMHYNDDRHFGGVWKKNKIASSCLLGSYDTSGNAGTTAGSRALGSGFLSLQPITMTETTISLPIYNENWGETAVLSSKVIAEVYE